MGHSSSTAEKYYQTRMAGSQSLSAYKEISNLTTPDPVSVESFFEDNINNSMTPKLAECRSFITQTGSTKTPKQIQDNVRNLIK